VVAFNGIMFILISTEICPAVSLKAYRWIDLQTYRETDRQTDSCNLP